jgi:transcriptional regulator GlxA family with amidase domain
MKRVIFVVFDGLQTLDLTGPAEVFAAAGRENPERARSEILIAAVGGGQLSTSSGCLIVARELLKIRPTKTDTVLVVGGEEDAIVRAMQDERLTNWLVKAARVVRRIGSVCSGAFVLAHAGLLDGKRVATHWSACERLAAFRQELHVDRDAIFIEEGKIWTSAGVTTGIDMALAMIEEDFGRAVADGVAARLVLYARRPGFQSQFSDALVAQQTASDPLGPVIAWAKTHLEKIDVEVLAKRAGMSLRTFHRRCLTVLGETPAKLVEKIRVERARTLLTTADLPAKELAVKCGFGSTARMNRAFSRALGMTPAAYRTLFRATEHPTGVRRSDAGKKRAA